MPTQGAEGIDSDRRLALTRRAFATGLTGSLAALGIGDAATAADRLHVPDDADLRDATLRGLARTADLGDPVLAAKADAAIARLESSDPEGAMLVRVYRLHDVAAGAYAYYGRTNGDRAATADLAGLHAAVRDCRPVSFRYTALDGAATVRTVLPLALVHPPQGIKLLGRCETRQDFRQFFVRAIGDLTLQDGRFTVRRLSLLRQLAYDPA